MIVTNFELPSLTPGHTPNERIRVTTIDGMPWFASGDVLAVLGYARGSRTYRLKMLGSDERRVLRIATPKGLQDHILVSESGFYKLVSWATTAIARPFQEWVTREVLPAIRRTGGYRLQEVTPEAVEEGTVAEMPEVAGVMAQMRELRAEMVAQTERLEARIAEEVAKVLAAVQKTPNPAELVPNLRAGEVAGLPFVPEGVTPYDVACAKV